MFSIRSARRFIWDGSKRKPLVRLQKHHLKSWRNRNAFTSPLRHPNIATMSRRVKSGEETKKTIFLSVIPSREWFRGEKVRSRQVLQYSRKRKAYIGTGAERHTKGGSKTKKPINYKWIGEDRKKGDRHKRSIHNSFLFTGSMARFINHRSLFTLNFV